MIREMIRLMQFGLGVIAMRGSLFGFEGKR
jgi:hypothetical protein